jgi:Protein of unknown function (DUF3455)
VSKTLRDVAFAALLFAFRAVPFSSVADAQDVPPELQPAAGQHELMQAHAKGYQIYSCKADGTQYSWVLKAPDAQLYDQDGKLFGTHFAGPSWKANDGSQVTGKTAANVPSPDPNSVPWLLVTVMSHSGAGALEHVTSVQRINTHGGKAPAAGCDPDHVGREVRMHYSADYVFFIAQ